MTSVSVIINPNAGQQKILKNIHQISEQLITTFQEVHFYKTTQVGEATQLVPTITRKSDLLIVAGGDGTVYEVINALCKLNNPPPLAIIPGGTCNDFSRAIGMDQDPVIATEQIIDLNIKSIDVGKTDSQYFLNFWGIGLVTSVSENINPNIKQLLGRASYYLSTLKQMNEKDPFYYNIETPFKRYQGNADMILVSNGPYTGGMKPFFPNAKITDGLFDVLIIKEAKLQSLLSLIKSTVTSTTPYEMDGLIYFQTPKLSINTMPTQDIDCDGERLNFRTPTQLKLLKQHLRMVIGT